MMSKVLKFWHGWFRPQAESVEHSQAGPDAPDERRHPSAIVVRTALRQKQRASRLQPDSAA